MKVPCDIIEDLLPLYHDDVCSEDSRNMVNEHLQTCEKCRMLLSMMDENIEEAAFLDSDRPMKAMKKAWDRGKKKSFRKGLRIGIATITAIVLVVLAIFFVPIPRHYTRTYTNVYYPDGTSADVTIRMECWSLYYLSTFRRLRGTVTVTDNQTGSNPLGERIFEMEYWDEITPDQLRYRKNKGYPLFESGFERRAWLHLYSYHPEYPAPDEYDYDGALLHENYWNQILIANSAAFEGEEPGSAQIYLATTDEDVTYEELYQLFYQDVFMDREWIWEHWGL